MNRFRTQLLALALALLPIVAPAQISTRERLNQLAEKFVAATAADDPITGSTLGLTASDGLLAIPSEAARAVRIGRLQGWKQELEAIAKVAGSGATLAETNNVKLLRADFDSRLNELLVRQTDRKDYAGTSLRLIQAIFSQFLHLPIVGREDATQADLDKAWDDLTARLEQGPAFIVAGQKLATRPGRLFATVGSIQLAGTPDFFNEALTTAATTQIAARPAALKRFLAAKGAVLATIAETKAYLDAHAQSWPENYAIGKAAYEQMLREDLLLPYDSVDIEHMARDELAHGWAEEIWLQALSKHRKIPFGPASGGGMAPGGPALVGYYRDRIAELTAFMKELDVVTVPAWLGSMQIVETPAFLQPVSPGASMYSPRLFSKSSTGYYFITPPKSLEEAAKRLDMNEDFDRDRIWSTAAHEAMPGHFLQLSIARRHPDLVRRIQHDAALAEGWAFYGEEMFVRLGPVRRRAGCAPVHRALGAGTRRARQRRPEARVGPVDGGAGGRFLRGAVGLHARGVAGGRQRHRPVPRLCHLVYRRAPAARDAAGRLHAQDGRTRLAARLSRPAAFVRLDPACGAGAGAAGRPGQAGQRRPGRRQLLNETRESPDGRRPWACRQSTFFAVAGSSPCKDARPSTRSPALRS